MLKMAKKDQKTFPKTFAFKFKASDVAMQNCMSSWTSRQELQY